MDCERCGRKSETVFRHLKQCKKCFFLLLEKRIKRILKEEKIIKNNKLLVIDKLSEYFLKRIVKMPIIIIKKSKSFFNIKDFDESVFENKKIKDFMKKNKIKRTIIPWTLDNEVAYLLKKYFKNSKTKKNKKFIKIFKNILEDELILFSKFKKIPFRRMKKTAEKEFLDKIEEKYPGTKNSFLKSMEKIEKF